MSEVLAEKVTLEVGARGLRSLFSSKPSDKDVQRVKRLGSLALPWVLATPGMRMRYWGLGSLSGPQRLSVWTRNPSRERPLRRLDRGAAVQPRAFRRPLARETTLLDPWWRGDQAPSLPRKGACCVVMPGRFGSEKAGWFRSEPGRVSGRYRTFLVL